MRNAAGHTPARLKGAVTPMRKFFCVSLGVLALGFLAQAAQEGKTEQKPAEPKAPASRTLKLKLNYTGAGKVDAKHNIIVFLFDSPDFTSGTVMPVASKSATAKDETLTFTDLATSPLYAVACYDPEGAYDGMSGPPPSGSSRGMYASAEGTPEPIKIEPGKTAEIELKFDDTNKMP